MDGAHLAAAAARGRWAAASAMPRAAAVVGAAWSPRSWSGAAPLFWQAAQLIARGEYVTPYYGWRSAPRGIDVLAPLLGHPLHPLFGAASERAHAAVSGRLHRGDRVGWRPAAACSWLLTRGYGAGSRRDPSSGASSGSRFLVWALGPFLLIGGFDTGLKLPEILARFVPFVANARMPGRAMVGRVHGAGGPHRHRA